MYGNMSCDWTGFCSGPSCPIFYECQGSTDTKVEKEEKKGEKKHEPF